MKWALLAFGIILALIALTTVVRLRTPRPPRPYDPRRAAADIDRFKDVHQQAAHYRASGVIPRWDP